MHEHILLRHREIPGIHQLEVYRQNGGFEAYCKAVTTMQPDAVIEVVKSSGLRGRGGAGFPIGQKWAFVDRTRWPHYIVANADESEPGTFKDREIMECNPFQFLEGVMIAAYAVQASQAYIYLRGEFWQLASQLDLRIAELEAAGLLGENLLGTRYALRVHTHLGAGAYVCGEETALLESIEGKRGQPRLRPPYPPVSGLFGKPTAINNVETLTNIPPILAHGGAWYHTFGTDRSPGVKIYSLSGCVNRPGNYELPLGSLFRELIYTHGGGIPSGRKIQAILPGGASSYLLPASEALMDTPMDYESVARFGAQLGSASVIVVDDSVDVPWLLSKTLAFFCHESCGKCPPCRLGTVQMRSLLEQYRDGENPAETLKNLEKLAGIVQKGSLCGLGQSAPNAVLAAIRSFPLESSRSKQAVIHT
jgi:NADH-quinone oxidoreductase subunit F